MNILISFLFLALYALFVTWFWRYFYPKYKNKFPKWFGIYVVSDAIRLWFIAIAFGLVLLWILIQILKYVSAVI